MAGPASPSAALDLTVADVLTRWPPAARAFLDQRMACVGCEFSAFDSLREALDIHAVPYAAFFAALERALLDGSGTAPGLSHTQGEDG
jgi:hybrid cluster-associated redox disulfide protein